MLASAFTRIEEIDRNFKGMAVSPDLQWLDAFDPRLAIRGLGWVQEGARSFQRVPDRVLSTLPPPVQHLSRCPASAFVAFRTDAEEIGVRMANRDCVAMSHMPLTGSAGAELYIREGSGWVPLAVAIPGSSQPVFERQLVHGIGNHMREYRLYLPLYKELVELSLGFPEDAQVSPVLPHHKPIPFYGTSVTQGGCANTAGSDFVSTVGRMLDRDTLNLGFSGNGKGEPEMASLMAELDAEMFVLNYSSNCDLARLQETLPEFVRILRHSHPLTPIVLLGAISFTTARWNSQLRLLHSSRRDFLMRFYLQARDAGDPNIHFIDGEGLLPPGLPGSTVDGLHPTSGGFLTMAERLVPHLQMIRAWSPRESDTAPLRLAPSY